MTVNRITAESTVIEYDEKEWDYIESLPEKCQRYIRMGLATPYDYGYKK